MWFPSDRLPWGTTRPWDVAGLHSSRRDLQLWMYMAGWVSREVNAGMGVSTLEVNLGRILRTTSMNGAACQQDSPQGEMWWPGRRQWILQDFTCIIQSMVWAWPQARWLSSPETIPQRPPRAEPTCRQSPSSWRNKPFLPKRNVSVYHPQPQLSSCKTDMIITSTVTWSQLEVEVPPSMGGGDPSSPSLLIIQPGPSGWLLIAGDPQWGCNKCLLNKYITEYWRSALK